ncbi:SusC/RagA family TonB-linked outer membrane protein [Bacteroidia bacterium]|nr:SusC/RagA family TonB-linked outer membrane protein [Bacteroidia bacterium]
MNNIYKFLGCIALLASTMQAYAVSINGKVTDEAGLPVVGAVVAAKDGTANGVTTDIDGIFALQVTTLPVRLEVSFLGYITQKITVGANDKLPLQIQLKEETTHLDEVVVVGYGTQRRKELTGSVASVSRSTLEQSSTSIDGLLGGAISGVNVTQVSGQPGAGSEIRIRGGNSIYASNDPLYVIDGFIYFSERGATQAGITSIESSLNPLSSINPSDIESIEILKDVSAKAIYGSRGANGVILVTTKKGKRGSSGSSHSIHYGYTIGIDKSAKKLDLMNAEQWTNVSKNVFHNTTWNNPQFQSFYAEQTAAGGNINSDWQNAVLRTGVTQTHELSISGGDEKTRYLLSGNYTDQQGIIINSGFERYSGRINLDREVLPSLIVGLTASADKSTQNALSTLTAKDYAGSSNPFKSGITNSLVYALFMPPVLPISDAVTGDYNYYNPFELTELRYYDQAANPVSDLQNSIGQTINSSLLGNFYATYNVPYIEGLTAKLSAGANVSHITQQFFAPPYTVLGINKDIQGRGSVGNRQTYVTQTEYLLTYTKKLSSAHYIDLMAGYTNQNTNTNIVLSRATHLNKFSELGMGQEKPLFNRANNASLHSLLARANYTLLGKYNLTATYRADKSSRFAEGHQWGHFPSVGLSWNVSDEDFLAGAKKVLSQLKLRLTYGVAGNQEIGFSEALQEFDPARYNGQAAYSISNLGNSNLRWETTTEYNAGIDAGFLNDRLTFVADVYYKKTSDLLVKVIVPFSVTSEPQTFNIGNVTNKGFELALNAKLIEQSQFTWSASANIARNVNTITSLGKNDLGNTYNNLTQGDAQEKILRVGESVGAFYGFIYEGVNKTNGDILYRNLDDNESITTGGDRTIIGSIQPNFTYGFSSTLNYRRWDFFVALQGSQGNEVYNKLRRHLSENNKSYNLSTDVLNAWSASNPNSDFPRADVLTNANTIYSRYVEDASFLKIKNITLGYTLPFKIDKLPMQVRAFVSTQNLFTFTRYTGYDPEIAGGIDTGVYPTSRTFLAGVGITF